jgi:hypothetical protein
MILEILPLCILSSNDLPEVFSACYELLLLNYCMLKFYRQLKRRFKRIRTIAIQLLRARKWFVSFIHQYFVRTKMPIQSMLK